MDDFKQSGTSPSVTQPNNCDAFSPRQKSIAIYFIAVAWLPNKQEDGKCHCCFVLSYCEDDVSAADRNTVILNDFSPRDEVCVMTCERESSRTYSQNGIAEKDKRSLPILVGRI